MTRAIFLLSKDPVAEHGGDVELSRLVMRLAADTAQVSAICLSHQQPGTVDADLLPGGMALVRVAKAGVQPLRLLSDTVRTGRSLAHARFDNDELVAAISAADADVFVAEHSYMAESFLRSTARARLVVNTHVSESLVWRATRGLLGRTQVGRLVRDELRVARAASAVGTYDAEEAEFYRAHGVDSARWLDLTLPPAAQVPAGADGDARLAAEPGGVPDRVAAVAADSRRYRRCRTVHHRCQERQGQGARVPGRGARSRFRRRPGGIPGHLPGDDRTDQHRRGSAGEDPRCGQDGSAGGRHHRGGRVAG